MSDLPKNPPKDLADSYPLLAPNKILLFIFILSLPLQTLSLSGSNEGEIGLKLYNLVFLAMVLFSINFVNPGKKILTPFNLFNSVTFILICVYFVFALASISWASEPSFALTFFIKIFFVFVELLFLTNLFYFYPTTFYTARKAFEISGVFVFLGLIYQIQKMGLWDYLLTNDELASATQSKNEYFGNVGLTFGGGKNLLGSWEAIVALLSYIHLRYPSPFDRNTPRYIPKLSLVCSATATILTLSRAALVSFIISVFIFHLIKNKRINYRLLFLTAVATLLLIAIIFTVITSSSLGIFSHLTNIGTSNDPGASDRFALWQTAFDAIKDRPLLGQGLGNGFLTFSQYQTPGISGEDNFHNLFLQNFVELGFFGGILFLLFWALMLISLLKILFESPYRYPDILLSTLICQVCFTIMALFQFKGGEPDIWLFFALNLAIQLGAKKSSMKKDLINA